MVVKLGSSLGDFLGSVLRGVKKGGKLLDLINILGFLQELKDDILCCISIFLRGE